MSKRLRISVIIFFIVLLVFSLYRITDNAILFSSQSLQLDFSAYYTAGKSLNHGFNPYENNILKGFQYWDGFAQFKHSRFLYPPLAAEVFRPLSLLNYRDAKTIWNILNLLLYLSAFFILAARFGLFKDLLKLLFSTVLMLNFFPFTALLERGQADCVTLFLLAVTLILLLKNDKTSEFISGITAAFASLFKLYLVLLIPFLLFKKKFRFVYGYLSGFVMIILMTISLYGYNNTGDFLFDEMPRIAIHASSGTDEMKIPVGILHSYFPMTPVSVTMIEGKTYLTESMSFNSKASLVKMMENIFSQYGRKIPNIVFSAVLFLFMLGLMFNISRRNKNDNITLSYWLILLLAVLLVSPFTWIMSLVWIVPLVIIISEKSGKTAVKRNFTAYILLISGFILTAFPDNLFITEKSSFEIFFKSRFILGGILLLISLIIYEGKKAVSKDTQGLKNTASA